MRQLPPAKNLYWREIPSGADVQLQGKHGSRYYVAKVRGKKFTIYWMGDEAKEAQHFLDRLILWSPPSGFGTLPRAGGRRQRHYGGR